MIEQLVVALVAIAVSLWFLKGIVEAYLEYKVRINRAKLGFESAELYWQEIRNEMRKQTEAFELLLALKEQGPQ